MSQLLIDKNISEKQELDDDNRVTTKKVVSLHGRVVDEDTGRVLFHLRSSLAGDGSTPQTVMFGGSDTIAGYKDDGSPILKTATKEEQNASFKKFQARAIKEQKALTKENGIDPSVVNVYGAENKKKG